MDKVLLIGTGIDKDRLIATAISIGISVIELEDAIHRLSTKSDLASYSVERLNEIIKSIKELDTKRVVPTEHRGKHRTHRNKWKK